MLQDIEVCGLLCSPSRFWLRGLTYAGLSDSGRHGVRPEHNRAGMANVAGNDSNVNDQALDRDWQCQARPCCQGCGGGYCSSHGHASPSWHTRGARVVRLHGEDRSHSRAFYTSSQGLLSQRPAPTTLVLPLLQRACLVMCWASAGSLVIFWWMAHLDMQIISMFESWCAPSLQDL